MMIKPLVCSSLVVIVAGCASPQVEYRPVTASDEEGAIKFKFARSMIHFDAIKEAKGGAKDPAAPAAAAPVSSTTGYSITSVPVSSMNDGAYAVKGTGVLSNWGVSTLLTAKLRPDSDLIQQVSVKGSDQRVTIIQGVATAAATIIPLLALQGPGAPPDPPEAIDVSLIFESPETYCGKKIADTTAQFDCTVQSKKGDWFAQIHFGATPTDAFPLTKIGSSYTTNSYLYSACRDAYVVLLGSDKKTTLPPPNVSVKLPATTVKVADVRSLQSLALPFTGNVTAADSCGAQSVADAGASPTGGLDVFNALLKGAQNVKDAYDKQNPPAAAKK